MITRRWSDDGVDLSEYRPPLLNPFVYWGIPGMLWVTDGPEDLFGPASDWLYVDTGGPEFTALAQAHVYFEDRK